MELHQTQKTVAKDNHDYRVVCCGRQWGKTTLAVLEILACAYARRDRKVAYFATTIDQARDIAWANLKQLTQPLWAKSPNESRLELTIKTQDGGTSEIFLDGFENVETNRGKQFDFIVIDEVASLKNWKYSWQAILEPTLAFRHGKALFISTPQGMNHFKDMFDKGQGDDPYWRSWKFTSYDNPFLPIERIEQAKKNSTEDYFFQEYMADFRKFTGLTHQPWDRETHFITPFDIPKSWQYARGFDYGSVDFTASVRVAVDNEDNWFVDYCYLNNTSDVKTHAESIRAQDYGIGFVPKWGDPSGSQWVNEFDLYDVHIQDANKTVGQGYKGWLDYCVQKVNERLKPIPGHNLYLPDGRVIQDAPRLFVLKNGKTDKFVSQIEALKWKETIAGEIVPILDDSGDPTGGHFDLMAAMRYLAVSHKQEQSGEMPDDTRWVSQI